MKESHESCFGFRNENISLRSIYFVHLFALALSFAFLPCFHAFLVFEGVEREQQVLYVGLRLRKCVGGGPTERYRWYAWASWTDEGMVGSVWWVRKSVKPEKEIILKGETTCSENEDEQSKTKNTHKNQTPTEMKLGRGGVFKEGGKKSAKASFLFVTTQAHIVKHTSTNEGTIAQKL